MSGEGAHEDYRCEHCGLAHGHNYACPNHGFPTTQVEVIIDPVTWKDTNPKDKAASTRLDLSLVPASAIAYAAMAFTEGDLKYGGYNWRTTGVKTSVYVAAAMRHLWKFYNGEECDAHTHVPHLGNALACIMVIVDAIESKKLNDDRPPAQETSIYAKAEVIVAHLQSIFKNGPARHTEKKP